MYKPSGGDSRASAPPNARDTSSLPPDHSSWHREPYSRDPRTDRGVDRDRVGAGKRNWTGDGSSPVAPFQGASGRASMSGNGFVPRSKPRFQGHYSGFFTESGRTPPSFSTTGPADNGLPRRFSRNPFQFGTGPAAGNSGLSGAPGLDYRANDIEERHSRDQFIPSGDGREGRDQPVPPHTPQILSDSDSLSRNGERAKFLSSRVNWELPLRTDRENSHGDIDLYSRRRSIVTQFDSGKDWGSSDKKSEGSRFERYGTGNRDATLGESEGNSRDSGFVHGWRRERGSSGASTRNTGFLAGNRTLGEHGGRAPLLAVSQDSLYATTLLSNLDADQPSPSKRPRLGWGQGLAKYEKKVGDSDDSPTLVERCEKKKEGEDEKSPAVEESANKRGGENDEHSVLVEGTEERRGRENEEGPPVEEHERKREGESDKLSVLVGDDENQRGRENEKSPALVRESAEVREETDRNPASPKKPEKERGEEISCSTSLIEVDQKRVGDTGTSPASFTESEKKGRGTNDSVPTSLTECEEKNVKANDENRSLCSLPVLASTGVDMLFSPSRHVVEEILASPAPCLHTQKTLSPVASPNLISASVPSSTLECGLLEQDLTGMSTDGILLEEAAGSGLDSLKHLDLPLEKEPAKTESRVSSEPSLSQVSEEGVMPPKPDATIPVPEPVCEEFTLPESSAVDKCVAGHLMGVEQDIVSDTALTGWTEQTLLQAVERMEFDIDLVKQEIAQMELEANGGYDDHHGLATSDNFHVSVPAEDTLSKVHELKEGPVAMDEDSQHLFPAAGDSQEVHVPLSEMSPTGVSATSTPLLHRSIETGKEENPPGEVIMTEAMVSPMSRNAELKVVPEEVEPNSTSSNKDVTMVSPGSASQIACSKELDHSESQLGDEVATDGKLVQENVQSMVESLILDNQEKARLSVTPFTHLLPQKLTTEAYKELYSSPMETSVWQKNMENHKNICEKLLEKLAERHHCHKFKERVLTLRFKALKEAWRQEQALLAERRHRPKAAGRWDMEGRSNYGPPSQRITSRLRPMASSVGRLDAASEAAQAMKKLMKEPPLEALRSGQQMPAMILDENERICRRFINQNALVDDPVAVELERITINPWTPEEKKVFLEKFALYNKNFREIASHLEYKTTADCVEYYYRNQKSDDFEKTRGRLQLKNRQDNPRSSSLFLAPTTPGMSQHREANTARGEIVAAMSSKLSHSNNHLKVADHAQPTASSSDLCFTPSCVEVLKPSSLKESKVACSTHLEVALPSGTAVEASMSSLTNIPCSVSSTAVPSREQCKERNSGKDGSGGGPFTTRSSHSEQHPAGLKGTRSMHLRHVSSRSAAQEVDSQWSDRERELFTNAVAMFGKDFRLIASHVGSKSQNQCKAFFSKTRKRLGLDELVEQFQANEAAVMLVQNFRHSGEPVLEVKTNAHGLKDVLADSSAGAETSAVEELIETATAVSTLESLKEQSKGLENDMMSDLSLVADAAAVMEESASMIKPESPVLESLSRSQPFITAELTTSPEQSQELPKVDRPGSLAPTVMTGKEEEEDSEATRSDDSYQATPDGENDIVVDQAAAALVGMSVMFSDKQGLKRSKSEVKPDPRSSPVSVFARSHSARLPFITPPPYHAVAEANLTMTSVKNARQIKERTSAAFQCKPTTRDRPPDMQDAYAGKKGREVAGGEAKPRREPTSWTQEEKEKFAEILLEHGKDWALLHESLPAKSLTQIKTYFQNSKARSRLPASDKLVNIVRSGTANRKRKAEEFETSRKAADLALPVKQKTRGSVAPPEVDTISQKEESSMGAAATVSGTDAVGVDILAYAARFGPHPGQAVDQDTVSMSGMQNLVCQMVSANGYAQGTPQSGQQVFRPGARPAVPSAVIPRPHNVSGMLQQLAGSCPPKPSQLGGHQLQALSSGVVQQVGPPGIHQVAQQMQQMLAQQQHLQKQLAILLQQQAAHPQQLLQQQQQATQAMQPLEQKLQQVVQQLQQQEQGRGQAQALSGELLNHMHFQPHQSPQARGILKVRPIRGGVTKPQPELAVSQTSGIFQHQISSRSHDQQLQQQALSMLLRMGTVPTSTAGSAAELPGHHEKADDPQDSDTDTDCEGEGGRPMPMDDSHQRMSVVHSTSSGQQQGAAHSTTSTLSSDSEQVKPWDVKLFGQSLLSKPPSLPLTAPRPTAGALPELLYPTASSAPAAILGVPVRTLSRGFRSSESLPSAFGRVGAPSAVAEGHPPTWPGTAAQSVTTGSHGVWSTASSLQVSGVTKAAGKEPEAESVQEGVSSVANHPDPPRPDAEKVAPAQRQTPQDEEQLCGSDTPLSAGSPVCSPAVEDSSSLDGNQTGCVNKTDMAPSSDVGPFSVAADPITPAQKKSLHIILNGHEQWG